MSVRSAEPNWPEIFRAISESVEPKPVGLIKKGQARPIAWEWKATPKKDGHGKTWYLVGVGEWQPRNWLEPAAAMELFRRMEKPCLDYQDGKYGCTPDWTYETGDGIHRTADTPEEAIVLATYAGLKEGK